MKILRILSLCLGTCLLADRAMPDANEDVDAIFAPLLANAKEGETIENARDFIIVVNKGKCGPMASNGRLLAIENTHPIKAIWVTFTVRASIGGYFEKKRGKWSPQRTYLLGCTRPGSGQIFSFKIIDARF